MRDGGGTGRLAGTGAGSTSALAHSGGPPVTMYLLLPRLHPVRFVATTVLVFIILNLIKVPGVRGGGSLRLGTGVATVVGGAGHPGGRAAGRWRSRGSASAYSTG